MYEYRISGYYTSIDAMQIVVGKYAWLESRDGNFFRLDFIHYD